MKRNLFAIFLALALVVALAFVVAPTAQAADIITPDDIVDGKIESNVTLDLQGQDVTVNVADGVTLSVINTAIREKNGVISNAGKLTNIGAGSIAPVAQDPASKVRFLAVGANNVYTFYPFSLELSQQGINTLATNPDDETLTEPAACIRVSFMAFSPLFDKISDYGFIVDGQSYSAEKTFDRNVTDLYADLLGSLRGKMDEDEAKIDTAKPVQGYMVVAGETYKTDLLEFTPRNILKGINKDAKLNLTNNQKTAIEKLFTDDNYGRVKNILTRFQTGDSTASATASITFDNTAKRTSYSTSKQVWEENGITVTNTGSVGDYANPVRFYKSSKVVIDYPGMTKIEFTCSTADYAGVLATSLGTKASGQVVTVEFDAPQDSYTATMSSAQTRVSSIKIEAASGVEHEHIGGVATCSAPGVCIDCDAEYLDKLACVDGDGNILCDTCGAFMPNSVLTLEQANGLGNKQDTNSYTTDKFYVEGIITDIDSTTYGNMTIKDDAGNTFYIYGVYSQDGKTRYDAMTIKPVVGDKIKVYGEIGNYNGDAQMRNGWMTNLNVLHEHKYSDPTCTVAAKCTLCGKVDGEPLAHTDENPKDHKCDGCGTGVNADLHVGNSNGICDYCGQSAEQGGNTPSEPKWTLLTDVNDLKADAQIVIVAKNANYAMSTTQNTNNRAQAAVTKDGNFITFGSDVQILTLKTGKNSGTWALYTGKGYLYAASSSKNYLKTETTLSTNSSWNISVTSSGVATIKSAGSNTRNWLRYNSSNNPPLFSCYGSGQADVAIYILK